MGKYVCSHCGFRCTLQNLSDCPYCGRETLEPEKSASELLEDINKILDE